MNVVFINTSDSSGGAAIACSRLQKALEKHLNINGVILTQEKKLENSSVISLTPTRWKKQMAWFRFVAERLLFLPYEKSREIRFLFNRGIVGIDISSHPLVQNADIIHLHWINFGFLSIHSLKKLLSLGKPIVWTLHDMWAFTGGCHHSGKCENYQLSCGNCKFLRNPSSNDISYKDWLLKKKTYTEFAAIGCSKWLTNRAKSSSLLANCYTASIPNPIDTATFCPVLKSQARRFLNLPDNKMLILFAAMRIDAVKKGFIYFERALQIFKEHNSETANEIEIIVFGSGNCEIFKQLPFPVHVLGHLSSETQISLAYNAASVFVIPSLEENLPNTIMESFACGTPVVGFDVGGISEMIEHKQNGYLSVYGSSESLAEGINWVLKNNLNGVLSKQARQKVINSYSEKVVAMQYKRLYQMLLKVS
ncbi:glycosyltransferase [Dyadobacter sediminis]|uniref:Glycosyltransferase n=1 Tax=Dyadobacter sediminis TaxID=1493691 RepID=A0A5R9K8G7_9BACT|nr:glycosyltransferase [Dyadobacter sediminis]TLU90325.1 glycosyltransferase [Dyadobacter sediminis]GGC06903.1 glycosyl transferase [Dyadobacter sediminis]